MGHFFENRGVYFINFSVSIFLFRTLLGYIILHTLYLTVVLYLDILGTLFLYKFDLLRYNLILIAFINIAFLLQIHIYISCNIGFPSQIFIE